MNRLFIRHMDGRRTHEKISSSEVEKCKLKHNEITLFIYTEFLKLCLTLASVPEDVTNV